MENIKDIWSQKQPYEKALSIIGIICSLSIIVLAGIQILAAWETAINVLEPLLGVLMFIQAIQNWKKNKVVAIFSLCGAIFISVVTIFIFVIR
ncbi:hypothetical protein ACFO6R_03765 [Eubacterium multiforme]|uniref:DUF3953 domain-containing protein n=1 Tax=Eubacterium multiforme TaxID=83339 RepID=A0ABT9UN99_9FIRM|nr:hypothetical protein [Eubacterium multiforme]MDQ0148122.1 hypothetical protein [Eubacterium multiforme]